MDNLYFSLPTTVVLPDITAESEFEAMTAKLTEEHPFTRVYGVDYKNTYTIEHDTLAAFYAVEEVLQEFEAKHPMTRIYQEDEQD